MQRDALLQLIRHAASCWLPETLSPIAAISLILYITSFAG